MSAPTWRVHRWTRAVAVAGALLVSVAAVASGASPVPPGMARIPAGSYAPLFRGAAWDSVESRGPARRISVAAFDLDLHPVTNAEFLAFVRAHPEWRRSRIKRLFAEGTRALLAHSETRQRVAAFLAGTPQ